LISGAGAGLLAYHVWTTIVIPLEVKEPLEIISYPSELSLFPGETEEFNITVQNHASVNYSVTLEFSLDNTTYQDNYVTFSNELYNVIPGQQILSAWLVVESQAPQLDASLTIRLYREDGDTAQQSGAVLILENVRFYSIDSTKNRTEIVIRNTGTSSAKIVSVYWSSSSFSALAKLSTAEYTLSPSTGVVDPLSSITVTIKWGTPAGTIIDSEWTSGSTYYFKVVTETGQYLEFPAKAPIATEQLEIQGVSFSGASGAASNTIIATVQNTGTSDLTVDKYKLGVSGTQRDITDVSVTQGNSASVTCTTGADGEAWVAGTTYDIYLITSTGKQFPYRATAP